MTMPSFSSLAERTEPDSNENKARVAVHSQSTVDRTSLSYWLPIVEAAGLPVPKTRLIDMPKDVRATILSHLWGEDTDPTCVNAFMAGIQEVAKEFAGPLFLRTDHTSGKHRWKDACFVSDPKKIGDHIYAIAEYSELAGFPGLPWSKWVLREMLPTMPVALCPAFGDMPVCKEFRIFVNGPQIECFHPYWPLYALEQGGCSISEDAYVALCSAGDITPLLDIASRAGAALGGRWSVDILETERGWFLTDMAEAEKSFHWDGCEVANEIARLKALKGEAI